ncbi:Hsp20 family protein, partial [Escherichia coli]|uniref:Hsp20 family protein n=1 Tax=Escherichia coli TaxID=562 RepID=UPI00169307ED
FEPLMESTRALDHGSLRRSSFGIPPRESYGYTDPPVSVCPSGLGKVMTVGDTYQVTADVSPFEPQDIVVLTYNFHIVIQAEKVADDGTVSNTFTHKCHLPKDMDPMSVSCSLAENGKLVITAKRNRELTEPLYRSEVKL